MEKDWEKRAEEYRKYAEELKAKGIDHTDAAMLAAFKAGAEAASLMKEGKKETA